jgi:hypothetical protein
MYYLAMICYQTGPTVYRSRTVFEDATPEVVRDFFWDDEFRPKWDPMLVYFKILEECQDTGTMIVHWIKKVCISEGLHNCVCLGFIIPHFSSNNVGIDILICAPPIFSSLSSAVIGNISLVEGYGRPGRCIIV